MKHSTYSIVIIGSGAAGLFAALKLSSQIDLPDGILLVSKSKLTDCNSYHAQGGIVAVLPDNKSDSVDLHVKDTLKAGAGLGEPHVISSISERSAGVIKDLDDFGVEFDKDAQGNYLLTLEAAHSTKRILHSLGDATGCGIIEGLKKNIYESDNIHIYENSMAVDLMLNQAGECQGVIVFNQDTQTHEAVHSSAVVLATGGMGQLYKYTTNPDVATGDGVAMAYSAGAEIQDIEFIQFHPTTLVLPDCDKRFLISEAVRGEGAKLVLPDGTRFMDKYDERAELAPRDIVTRAIFNEMKLHNLKNVFLDATLIGEEKIHKRFPSISKKCLEYGIDITKDYIPVAPSAHYSMGGVRADVEGITSVKGLYAIGEAASTGLHGANRLASNSLLECVVCANELVNHLTFIDLSVPNQFDKKIMNKIKSYDAPSEILDCDVSSLKKQIQEIMWDKVGILRDENSLKQAMDEIKKIKKIFKLHSKYESRDEYELRNMIINAILITDGAIERKESRGGHYRTDFEFSQSRAYHSVITNKKEEKC